MTTDSNKGQRAGGPAFEWWMFSFIAAGAGFSAFISLLIPPYVTEATGDAANAGVVMAVISLAAVLGPVLGGFADKYRAHRLVLSLGVLGLALGFVAYALSAESGAILALDAILLGVGRGPAVDGLDLEQYELTGLGEQDLSVWNAAAPHVRDMLKAVHAAISGLATALIP